MYEEGGKGSDRVWKGLVQMNSITNEWVSTSIVTIQIYNF